MTSHTPVLRDQAIAALTVKPGGYYLDATYGRGGHSKSILPLLGDGRLVVMDRDPDAIADARQLASRHSNMLVIHSNFATLDNWMIAHDILLDGALFDLGVSSAQLDQGERGFSFARNAPLDMRMDNSSGETASEWLNRVSQPELARVIREYGEERFASRIATAICRSRPIHTTAQLVDIIESAQPVRDRHKHPATRTFQAIRIAINDELDAIRSALEAAKRVMKKGARLVVISFHSLEDRLVKRFIAENSGTAYPSDIPVMGWNTPPILKAVQRCFASEEERRANPRARSAVMRVAEFV